MADEDKRPLPENIPTTIAEEGIRSQRRAFIQCLEELLALDDEHLRGGVSFLQKMIIDGMIKEQQKSKE